jgi:glutamate-5-semialdehyde dehydrogenase
MVARLRRSNVEIRAERETLAVIASGGPQMGIKPAGPDDFDTEWMSLTLGVKVVSGLDEAIDHIAAHSTEHSDSILTSNWTNAHRFVNEVNSSAVYVNASTRFTDGGQFGLGAEVAVSTQKLHARGPMGLEALTTYKWVGIGDGHVRE